MSINQHYHGTPVIIPPAPAALVIADYLRYYQYRVSDTSYRPYVSVAEANASVNVVVRPGRVVLIGNTEYWWKDSTSDNGLIKKGSGIRTVNTVGPDASGNVNLPVTAATATNLSVTTSATQVSVESSTGKNAVLLAADNSNAGLLLPAEKAIIAATSGANTGDQDISGIAANATAISNEATARGNADTGLQTNIAANANAISVQTTRLNTLVTGAPPALDTLPKIAAQLASDESGVAAILATQQQHTQQIAGIPKLYSATGQNTDGTMTQKAISDVVAGAVPTSLLISATGAISQFGAFAFAQTAAVAGDTIYVTGYHGLLDINKSITIRGSGTANGVQVGYLTAGLTVTIAGITVLGRFVICASDSRHTVLIDGIRTGPGTCFEQYSLSTNGGSNTTVRGVRIRNSNGYVPIDGTSGSGVLRFQERDLQSSDWYFEDCILASDFSPIISGFAGPNTRVTLYNTTDLRPAPGKPVNESYLINTTTPAANRVNDLRTAYASPTALTPTSGTVTLDFAANPRRTLAANGNVSFVTSNRSTAGAEKTVYLKNTTGSDITLTYEAWVVMMNGTPLPVKLAANKELIIVLTCLGTSVSDVKVAAVTQN